MDGGMGSSQMKMLFAGQRLEICSAKRSCCRDGGFDVISHATRPCRALRSQTFADGMTVRMPRSLAVGYSSDCCASADGSNSKIQSS